MSVLSSLYTGVSGLQSHGAAMGVIGDNIANANTTSFKGSRAEFSDVMASNLKGLLGGNQIGRGVKVSGVTSIFSQGNLNPTERDSDMAISGDGFFILKNESGGEVSYTRDGSFRFDDKGRLRTVDNQLVQGYKIDPDNGKPASALGDIQFASSAIPAKETTELKVDTNLDVRTPPNPLPFDVTTAEKVANLSTAARIYDSTGSARSAQLFFYKREEGNWEWYATADGADLQGGTPGVAQQIASGKLSFTPEGKLNTDEITSSTISFKGAKADQKIDFNFGDSIVTRNGTGTAGSTQYGSKSQVFRQLQNGYSAGTLTNFSVDDKGTVSGSYSNGVTKALASIALARFENNEGLYKLGSNRYKEAVFSGQPLTGFAGEASRGTIVSKSLEQSNVDLAAQFVQMIQTQRNFQANAKTITTSDELLQDVINLRR